MSKGVGEGDVLRPEESGRRVSRRHRGQGAEQEGAGPAKPNSTKSSPMPPLSKYQPSCSSMESGLWDLWKLGRRREGAFWGSGGHFWEQASGEPDAGLNPRIVHVCRVTYVTRSHSCFQVCGNTLTFSSKTCFSIWRIPENVTKMKLF